MKLFVQYFLLLVLSFSLHAQESHKIGLGVNYHLDQNESPGYQLSYQWQFNDSFEFETQYIDTNEIKLVTNDDDFYTDFDQIAVGANLVKQFDKYLSIKSGIGLSVITSSSNEDIVENNTFSPYLSISASYEIADDMFVNLGQFTQFQEGLLGTNHNVFLSFSYRFSSSVYQARPQKKTIQKPIVKQEPKPAPVKKQQYIAPVVQSSIESNKAEVINEVQQTPQNINGWYVQLGAFSERDNAKILRNALTQKHTDLQLEVVQHLQYFRVVSSSFDTKQRAEDYVNMLQSHYSLSGYITQLTH